VPADEDLLEGGLGPPWWRRVWTALPRWGRLCLTGLLLVSLVVVGTVQLRGRAVERDLAGRVDLAATVGIWSSSTAVPGGAVRFYAVVRNEGPRPVTVTAIDGSGAGLQVRMRDDIEQPVVAGGEIQIPLSVQLTCGARQGQLATEIAVRRADGTTVVRGVDLQSAGRVLGVAATLCGVRPDLRGHELSGPILRRIDAAKGGGD
jgi:hypothetical protein